MVVTCLPSTHPDRPVILHQAKRINAARVPDVKDSKTLLLKTIPRFNRRSEQEAWPRSSQPASGPRLLPIKALASNKQNRFNPKFPKQPQQLKSYACNKVDVIAQPGNESFLYPKLNAICREDKTRETSLNIGLNHKRYENLISLVADTTDIDYLQMDWRILTFKSKIWERTKNAWTHYESQQGCHPTRSHFDGNLGAGDNRFDQIGKQGNQWRMQVGKLHRSRGRIKWTQRLTPQEEMRAVDRAARVALFDA